MQEQPLVRWDDKGDVFWNPNLPNYWLLEVSIVHEKFIYNPGVYYQMKLDRSWKSIKKGVKRKLPKQIGTEVKQLTSN